MKLIRNESYQRKERKFFKKHAHLLDKYAEILKKLKNNPFDLSLKTHSQVDTISPNQSQAEIIQFAVDRFLGI